MLHGIITVIRILADQGYEEVAEWILNFL